jgi:hypothetical protein
MPLDRRPHAIKHVTDGRSSCSLCRTRSFSFELRIAVWYSICRKYGGTIACIETRDAVVLCIYIFDRTWKCPRSTLYMFAENQSASIRVSYGQFQGHAKFEMACTAVSLKTRSWTPVLQGRHPGCDCVHDEACLPVRQLPGIRLIGCVHANIEAVCIECESANSAQLSISFDATIPGCRPYSYTCKHRMCPKSRVTLLGSLCAQRSRVDLWVGSEAVGHGVVFTPRLHCITCLCLSHGF